MAFEGRAVMVTGGTGNLGATVVRRYLGAGAHVALPVRDATKGEALRDDLVDLPGAGDDARLFVLEAHPGDADAMERAVEEVMTRWGRLDALANLAGHYEAGPPWDLDAVRRLWQEDFLVAATAAVACLRPMRARGHGRIVSVGAFGANRGGRDSAGYAIAKTALVRWSESLAAAVKDEGITVNVVQPSVIDHPENRRLYPKADPAKWVRPDELASLILFLTSDEASGVTGAAIPVTART